MENKIREIFTTCLRIKSSDLSLIAGSSGRLLMIMAFYKKKALEYDNEFGLLLQTIVDEIINCSGATFANGKSGLNWLFGYLFKQGVIDKEDYCNFCYDELLLQKISLAELDKGNWDFLHGAVGMAYYLLYDFKYEHTDYFVLFFEKLEKIYNDNNEMNMFPNHYFEDRYFVKKEVNLGLAHGMPSILKFCIECYKKNVCKTESERVAKRIIDFLYANINADTRFSFYPSVARKENSKQGASRLAWCYGDLGIGFILYQAGITFQDQNVIDYSLKILKQSTNRIKIEDTLVFDAGICHGSAGVAHIFNKMWYYTDDSIFKNATEYWIQKTLDFAVHKDGISGYKKYNPKDKTWISEAGLLEGSAGIGLVLLSYLTGDFSWDYCLMLND